MPVFGKILSALLFSSFSISFAFACINDEYVGRSELAWGSAYSPYAFQIGLLFTALFAYVFIFAVYGAYREAKGRSLNEKLITAEISVASLLVGFWYPLMKEPSPLLILLTGILIFLLQLSVFIHFFRSLPLAMKGDRLSRIYVWTFLGWLLSIAFGVAYGTSLPPAVFFLLIIPIAVLLSSNKYPLRLCAYAILYLSVNISSMLFLNLFR